MLRISPVGKPGTIHELFVLDIHHHIGSEKDRTKNLNPAGPDGSFNFLRGVFFGNQWKAGLQKEMEDNPDEFSFSYPEDGRMTKPHPVVEALMGEKQYFGVDLETTFKNTFLADIINAFPMQDTYRDREVEYYSSQGRATPEYSYSNNKILDVISKFPNSLRFTGFGRVIPQQDGFAEEMERAVANPIMRGFKLHPKSDNYSMGDPAVVDAVVQAAKLDVPILFHTSFISEVEDMRSAANQATIRLVEESGLKELGGKEDRQKLIGLIRTIRRIRLIIGHCGWHTSPELFELLMHPNIYGEISGIKGENVKKFFTTAYETQGMEYDYSKQVQPVIDEIPEFISEKLYPDYHNLPQYNGWSSKIMYGTDFPFLDQNQAIDVLKGLLSVDFPGGLADIEAFIGLNGLRILSRKSRFEAPVGVTGPKKKLDAQQISSVVNPILQEFEKEELRRTQVSVSYLPGVNQYPYYSRNPKLNLDVRGKGESRELDL